MTLCTDTHASKREVYSTAPVQHCMLRVDGSGHTLNGLMIKQLRDVHQRTRLPRDELTNVEVVTQYGDRRPLSKTEAIIMKQEGPILNTKTE